MGVERQIPSDLKELYGVAQAWRHTYGSQERFGSGTVEVLIERIADLAAEVAAKDAEIEQLVTIRGGKCGFCGQPIDSTATVEKLKQALRNYADQDAQALRCRTDQQLQPKGEQG